ncbi:MAG: hypothetical protein WCN81_12655, partial [Actinomycetes bacterium]
ISGATDWLTVSAGWTHSLALKTDGTLYAWGTNDDGQLGDLTTAGRDSPEQIGSDHWSAISAGGQFNFNLAIRSDGTLWAWGNNYYGQLGTGDTVSVNHPVQIGDQDTWIAVSAGMGHSLALKSDGTLWAWGYNGNSQLGDGTNVSKSSPIQIGTSGQWVAVSAGVQHSLALKADGTLYAWGYNGFGQLGDGTSATSMEPRQIGSSTNWAAISAGGFHSMALMRDGTVWTWGSSQYWQTGDGIFLNGGGTLPLDPVKILNLTDTTQPTVSITSPADGSTLPSATPQLQLALSADATATEVWVDGETVQGKASGDDLDTLSDGQHTLWVRVRNVQGNLAAATSTFTVATPPPPQGPMTLNGGESATFNTLAAIDSTGVQHATQMRTSTDGTNWTGWRDFADHSVVALPGLPGKTTVHVRYRNAAGQVIERQADVTRRAVPVAAGASWDLALRSGSLYAWGDAGGEANAHGQFGDSTTVSRTAPELIGSDHWVSIAAGDAHTAAVRSDGTLWAWGSDQYGQLGNGAATTADQAAPGQIGADVNWATVAAGSLHTLALKADGSLYAWGRNGSGQLGDGTMTDRDAPVHIGDGWAAISAGVNFSLGIKTDGTLWSWGENSAGQLGLGETNYTWPLSPTQVGNDTDWLAVAADGSHAVALKADGGLYTWGANDYRQVGDGSNTNRRSPVHIQDSDTFTGIAAGVYHTMAIRTDGT